MKNVKLLATWSIILIGYTSVWSQIRLDLMAGISPGSNPRTTGIIVNRHNPSEEFVLNMYKVKPQFYGGIKAHVDLASSFFTEAGIVYTQKTSRYAMRYTQASEENRLTSVAMNETEHLILLPVSIGVRLGSMEVLNGFTATGSIAKNTELSHVNGFESEGSGIQWGWHTGIRHTMGISKIGIEYQGSFSRVGTGASVNGQSLQLMNVPGQFLMTYQIGF